MRPIIKVTEDDDTFFFGPNAVLFIQHGNKQIQITFTEDGGANIVQFEPHGAKLNCMSVDHDFLPERNIQVFQ